MPRNDVEHCGAALKLNAEQTFWNGAPCPLGYKLVEVEKPGTKIKKTLAATVAAPFRYFNEALHDRQRRFVGSCTRVRFQRSEMLCNERYRWRL
jgi:hypothetical protein